jgi:hypothetical protein
VDHAVTGPRVEIATETQPPTSEPDYAAIPHPEPLLPGLEFSPTRQQVHGPYTWEIRVRDPGADPVPDSQRLQVFYNGMEISRAARFQFELDHVPDPLGGETPLLRARMPDLRLGVMEDHAIRVQYTTAAEHTLVKTYQFPSVHDLKAQERILYEGPFRISPEVRDAIYAAGLEYHINPALLCALIAQESGFNPYALSKADALGLTQITHLTEHDIVRQFDDWPRYPGISRIPRRKLRRMIPAVVNSKNEWRLDAVKSVWGGGYYLAYLRDRLQHEANREIVQRGGPDQEQVVTEAALAAYNSGLNRTLYLIKIRGEDWLEHRKLREAKRYVRKIMSFYGMFRDVSRAEASDGGTG